ncbi:MAG: transposase, partial [Porphyrobacter sp.]|nr:transposase [Porphyrobacter sp.]
RERVFQTLSRDRDNEYLMIDSDPAIDKHRNRIEKTIGTLKQLRRITTRYDRLPANYLARIYPASPSFWCCMPHQPSGAGLPGSPRCRSNRRPAVRSGHSRRSHHPCR